MANLVPSLLQAPVQSAAPNPAQQFGSLVGKVGSFLGSGLPGLGMPGKAAAPAKAVAPAAAIPFSSYTPGVVASPIQAPSTAKVNSVAPISKYTGVNSVTLPNGNTAQVDSLGNIIGAPTSFSIDTGGSVGSDALGNTATQGDLMSKYQQYVQQLSQASQYSPAYQAALEASQAADARAAELKSNFYSGNNLPGDTIGYAQGMTTKEGALNDIAGLRANQALQVQELVRQGNIAAAQALVEGTKPQTVGVGTSLVSPNGDVAYQSPYLYKPSASQIGDIAQNLLATGQAPDYASAYNMAQQISLNSAQGQSGFAPGTGATAAQSPVYQNVIMQLQQGVPFNKIVTGRGQFNATIAQQAYQDFLSGNVNYNAVSANAAYNANIQSYAEQTKYVDTVQRSYQTALQNLGVLTSFMQQYGINNSSIPIVNQINNKAKAGLLDPGAVAAFQSTLTGLRTEYAQVLSRGGQVTDSTRNEAAALIPDNLSPAQLKTVTDQLSKEGANAIKEAYAQLDTVQKRVASDIDSQPSVGANANSQKTGYVDVSNAVW